MLTELLDKVPKVRMPALRSGYICLVGAVPAPTPMPYVIKYVHLHGGTLRMGELNSPS